MTVAEFNWGRHDLCSVEGDGITEIAIIPARFTTARKGKEVEDLISYSVVDEHRRVIDVAAVVEESADSIEWFDKRGRSFQLEPLTVARYNAIRSPGSRAMRSMAELRAMYLPAGAGRA